MFSDNETSSDLLGFEDLVEDLCAIVRSPNMLPVTIGVLGDWGSGKSSLLQMADARLRAMGVIVVPFSPWRIESYDDAKSALLDAVVEHVAAHLPPVDPGDERREKVLQKLNMLRKRVRWLRAAGLAAKHIVTMSAPSLDELDKLLRDEDTGEEPVPSTARLARDFHEDFAAVVAGVDEPVVVLVDDLDRCLPEKVLDVLQAIRLFLSVEGTAFVLATDERVVRDAVRLRYPQAAAASETDLPQEYLEKIVQVPLRIPPLGPAEVETYLNLLIAEKHLGLDDIELVRTRAASLRSEQVATVCMNVGIARSCLPSGVPEAAERDFELLSRVARLVASGLKGNPRQAKRFLNAFELRRGVVRRRGLQGTIDDGVLAKLAVLEYAHLRRFRTLYEWQAVADGRPPQLAEAERIVRPPDGASSGNDGEKRSRKAENNRPDPSITEWTEHPWLRSWLALDPPLKDVDLRPYFVLARDALHGSVVQARRLPEHLQALLSQLANDAQRDAAVAAANALSPEELSAVVEAGLERLPTEAAPLDLGLALVEVAASHPQFVGAVLTGLRDLPFGSIAQSAPISIATRLRHIAPGELTQLLDTWEDQTVEPRLSRAAQTARRLMSGGS
jgi:hypothetical protein